MKTTDNYYFLPNSVHRISETALSIKFEQVKHSGLASGWTFDFWLSEYGYIPVSSLEDEKQPYKPRATKL